MKIKAINLVFQAQPMIACLRSIAQAYGHKSVVRNCDEWLDKARSLMSRKGMQTGGE